jgi:hypothetical protein
MAANAPLEAAAVKSRAGDGRSEIDGEGTFRFAWAFGETAIVDDHRISARPWKPVSMIDDPLVAPEPNEAAITDDRTTHPC